MTAILAQFRAPWSRSLRVMSTLSAGVLFGMVVIGLLIGPQQLWIWRAAMVGVPIVILLGTLPFMVRGYVLTEHMLEIKRVGWSSMLPLAGLLSASGDVEAFRGAFRVFGNGGLFGITGWFWSRKLGRFRAFATDPSRAVVLRYAKRKVVVTPHDPQHFIVRVRTLAGLLNSRSQE